MMMITLAEYDDIDDNYCFSYNDNFENTDDAMIMTMIRNMIDIWHWSVWARADYQDDCEINLFRE